LEDGTLNKNTDFNISTRTLRRVESFDDFNEVEILKFYVNDLESKLAKRDKLISQLEERVHQLECAILFSQSGVVSDSQPAPGTQEKELASNIKEQITHLLIKMLDGLLRK